MSERSLKVILEVGDTDCGRDIGIIWIAKNSDHLEIGLAGTEDEADKHW